MSIYAAIEDAARNLYIKALKDIPKDVRAGLKKGYDAETQAGQQTASKVMLTVLKNIELADAQDTMVCQDTGLPIYKLYVGNRLHLDLVEVKEAPARGLSARLGNIRYAPTPFTRSRARTPRPTPARVFPSSRSTSSPILTQLRCGWPPRDPARKT